MHDPATSRAREVIAEMFLVGDFAAWSVRGDSDYKNADDTLARLHSAGLAIIDTRTHAAVPREPDDALIKKIGDEIHSFTLANMEFGPFGYDIVARNVIEEIVKASAAIAAVTDGG